MKFAMVRRIKCYRGNNCTKSIFICNQYKYVNITNFA